MGRATRWLQNLVGWKKPDKEPRGRDGMEEIRAKKRWSFCNSGMDPSEVMPEKLERAKWMMSMYTEREREQNKHAIAVAAATAAAADAAVAAARAAVEVVRLTSKVSVSGFGVSERLAAVKIQRVFRGYLAKKALRALKALVKLQALVRGYLVRKQAVAALHSMEALVRAQATIQARKSSRNLTNYKETRSQRSFERFDDARSDGMASINSRKLSESVDNGSVGSDRSPKIVEIDTCRPKSRSSLRTNDFPMDATEHDQFPAQIAIPDCRRFKEYDWCFIGDGKCRFSSTTHCTPRYMSFSRDPSLTPVKSVGEASGSFRKSPRDPEARNFMTNTQSSEAKVRSQSAPKQRPEAVERRKRIPFSEITVQSRASLSDVGLERDLSKGAVFRRVDGSIVLGVDAEREFYMQRKW